MAPRELDELELGWVDGLRLGWRTLLRGLNRPIATLIGTLLFALATAGVSMLLAPEYAPRYVLRVTEPDREPGSMPRPRRELREYVVGAVLTSEPLFEVIRAHGLYPGLMKRNPRSALESFREDIEVEVYGNHFLEERAATARPRTASLAIRYRSKDADLALAVTRDLGVLVAQREKKAMRDQAARSARVATSSMDRLKQALSERQRSLAEKQLELRRARDFQPQREVELVSLWGSVGSLERELLIAERRKASLDLGAELERTGAGLMFDVVDEGALPRRARFDLRDILALAGLGLALGLPMVALAVGAFSSNRGAA